MALHQINACSRSPKLPTDTPLEQRWDQRRSVAHARGIGRYRAVFRKPTPIRGTWGGFRVNTGSVGPFCLSADQSRPLRRAFGPPGFLKVSLFMRSAPQQRMCPIVEVGKSLPEGLVAARQQSRREHVGTIRTMLAHVPGSSSIKDIGTVDDFR